MLDNTMDEEKRKSSRSFDLEKGGKRSFDLNKTAARKFDLAKESDEVSLKELKAELLADGKIDAEEVAKLSEVLYADGKIDREEADFLFELNDAVSGHKNDPSWNKFFVQAISDYLLNDEASPGIIDEEEGKWLAEKIGADGQVDGVEKQLLANLKQRASTMPPCVSALMPSDGHRTKTTHISDKGDLPDRKEGAKPKKWLWLILALAAAAIIAFFCMNTCQNHKNGEQAVPGLTEEKDAQVLVADSAKEDSTQEEKMVQEDQPDTPAESESAPDADDAQDEAGNADIQQGNNPKNVEQTPADQTDTPSQPTPKEQPKEPARQQPAATGTYEDTALDVIRGLYGNGEERKQRLGDAYKTIQDIVNDMYRKGLVY